MTVDPAADIIDYFVVLECVVEMADRVIRVAGVVNSRSLNHEEVSFKVIRVMSFTFTECLHLPSFVFSVALVSVLMAASVIS